MLNSLYLIKGNQTFQPHFTSIGEIESIRNYSRRNGGWCSCHMRWVCVKWNAKQWQHNHQHHHNWRVIEKHVRAKKTTNSILHVRESINSRNEMYIFAEVRWINILYSYFYSGIIISANARQEKIHHSAQYMESEMPLISCLTKSSQAAYIFGTLYYFYY